MSDQVAPLEQRYYHAVILRFRRTTSADQMRDTLGRTYAPSAEPPTPPDTVFRAFRSPEWYGSVASDDVRATFLADGTVEYYSYDFFMRTGTLFGKSTLVLGFPYARLARAVVTKLESRRIQSYADFVKIRVSQLVQAIEASTPGSATPHIAKIVTGIEGDAINRLALGGRDPLQSDLFKYVKAQYGPGVKYRQCIVALAAADGTAASVHFTLSGNCQFWMRADCRNIHAFIAALEYADSCGAWRASPEPPSIKAPVEDEE